MPVFQKQVLIKELQSSVRQILETVQSLPQDNDLLNRQPGPEKWSVLQVLGHLNYYNRAYLPKLQSRLRPAENKDQAFKTGWLGNYFTNMMRPKQDGTLVSKMSAPKESKPELVLNAQQIINDFIAGEGQLLQLLQQASTSGLDARVPTSISSLIKLKAGDTFRFLVAHQERHLLQLQKTLEAVRAQ